MARSVASLELSDFAEAWLAKAELSLDLPAAKKQGLSFFFEDEAEFAAFLRAARLPEGVLGTQRRLRSRFDLLPRYWLKLHYDFGEVSGFSQYFQLSPVLAYPITTLRLFLRMHDHHDVASLETMLEPALRSPGTVYGLILKHRGREAAPVPRLSLRLERTLLEKVLSRFSDVGYLSPDRAEALLGWDGRVGHNDAVYVSLEPGTPQACTLDFEEVPAAALPVRWQATAWGLLEETRFDFVKCRLAEDLTPEWSGYLRLSAVRSRLEYHADGTPRAWDGYLDEVRRYYDRVSPVAVAHIGTTYQAGLITAGTEPSPTASNLYLAERAGIRPGDRVLDAGCGVCGPATDIARHIAGVSLEAITLSEVQAEEGRCRVAEAGLAARIRVSVGDYHQLPYPDESFDATIFFESFGYTYDPKTLLEGVHRVLRPGGRLYIKDVFRREGALSAQELDELATFNRLYAFRAPTAGSVVGMLEQLGFVDVRACDLTDRLSTEHFHRGMLVADGSRQLNDFGKRHFHTFSTLPVRFWEVTARKPLGQGAGAPRGLPSLKRQGE